MYCFFQKLLLWLLLGFGLLVKGSFFWRHLFVSSHWLYVFGFSSTKSAPYLKMHYMPASSDNYQGAVIIVCGQSSSFPSKIKPIETAKRLYICTSSLSIWSTSSTGDITHRLRQCHCCPLLPDYQYNKKVTQKPNGVQFLKVIKKAGKTLPFCVTLS